MMTWIFMTALLFNGDATIVKTFDNPEKSGEFLNMPFSMDFGRDGRLYLVDRDNARVLIWNAEGRFIKGFGSKGEGPGELFYPLKINVTANEVWVWDFRKRMSIFDLEGGFKTSIAVSTLEPRNFAVPDSQRALLGFRQHTPEKKLNMVFQWMDREGNLGKILKSFPNESVLAPVQKGSNYTTIKAYSPEIDIQRDGADNLYIGFSQEPFIYRLDASGAVADKRHFTIPTEPPNEEEQKVVEELSIPLPTGGRFVLSEVPGLKISFDHDKALWTNFLVKDDKIAFVLTPLGTLRGVGNGFFRASYYINDLKSGDVLSRGAYAFPEDSNVLYRNGHILACIVKGDEGFEIAEITLKGL